MENNEQLTPLRRYLRERGLSLTAGAEKCGVSIETMQVVAGGSPTLPCLALAIGKGLGLTQEEVRPLGKPLTSQNWGREGIPMPKAVDRDPEWYRRLAVRREAEDRALEQGYYVDVMAVMNRLMELDRDVRSLECLPSGKNLREINSRKTETRKRYLQAIADEIGLPVEDISTMHKSSKTHLIRYQVDYGIIRQMMEQPGNGEMELADRMYTGRQDDRRCSLRHFLRTLESGDPVQISAAARLAAGLGARLEDIGQRVIVTY